MFALARAPGIGDALTYLGSGGSSTHGAEGREAKSRRSSGVICGASGNEGGCSGGRGGRETHHNRRGGERVAGAGKLACQRVDFVFWRLVLLFVDVRLSLHVLRATERPNETPGVIVNSASTSGHFFPATEQ